MAGERWDPYREMVSLRDAMSSLFQEGASRAGGAPATLPLDVHETDNEFVVEASLPGVKPEDVQITVHGDTLVIRGESRAAQETKGQTWHVRERRFGTFQRALNLSAPVDADRASAAFEHGVLTLTLPKAEQAKPKQIRIGGGASSSGRAAGG